MSTIVKSKNGSTNMLSRLWDAEKSLLSDFFDGNSGLLRWNDNIEVPAMNVVENEKEFLIEVAAPGKRREDFKIEVGENSLTISSEKEEKKEENEPNFRRKEFSYDYFSRTFSLPGNCLPDEITAKYEDGILQLRLPKEQVQPPKPKKQIKVD
jgi:HSP20 family protein